MAARIQSLRNGIDPVDELSRDDLQSGDVVAVSSLDGASTYNWSLVFVPEGSTATFSGVVTAVSPGSFTVDLAGPYLVRLVVDAGLPTESTQYVRLRALTSILGLTLVAAGERRDGTGIIPVDVDVEGWANEQNANLLALEGALAPLLTQVGQDTTPVPVLPGNTYRGLFITPYDLEIVGVKVNAEVVPTTAGVYTLAVENADTATNLLAAVTFDLTSLVAETPTSLTLTATAADLLISTGTRVRFTLTSDNVDLLGDGIYVQFLYRSQ